jgi:vacuolar-type H+-ATPase subunit H
MNDKMKTKDAFGALQRIKEAEEKARKIVQKAREKTAVKIIQDAHEEAEKIKERHLKRARKKAEEKRNAIIQEAAKEAGEIREKAKLEVVSLKKKAETTMSGAVNQISDRIKHFIEKGES